MFGPNSLPLLKTTKMPCIIIIVSGSLQKTDIPLTRDARLYISAYQSSQLFIQLCAFPELRLKFSGAFYAFFSFASSSNTTSFTTLM